jgi:hypothetical protein
VSLSQIWSILLHCGFVCCWARDAGFPKARIAVVGTGTGQVFDNIQEGRDQLQVAFTPSKGELPTPCPPPKRACWDAV